MMSAVSKILHKEINEDSTGKLDSKITTAYRLSQTSRKSFSLFVTNEKTDAFMLVSRVDKSRFQACNWAESLESARISPRCIYRGGLCLPREGQTLAWNV